MTDTDTFTVECAHRCGAKLSTLSSADHAHCRHGAICWQCWRELQQATDETGRDT